MSHICQLVSQHHYDYTLEDTVRYICHVFVNLLYGLNGSFDRTYSPETIVEEIIEQTSPVCNYHDLENVEDIRVEKNHKYCALYLIFIACQLN